jgi:predicted O-methyltransferase YrrM
MPKLVELPDAAGWRVGDTEFVTSYSRNSTLDRFALRKTQDLVEKYVDLCPAYRGANIVELGIASGGSTALLALLAEPRRLVACELASEPVRALDEFRDRHGLADVVRPYYGVDQADRARLRAIVEAEFGDAPLDLVIDDASHLYDETIASFEVLFPRLRPDGLFIIEDWASDYARAKLVAAALAETDAPGHEEAMAQFTDALDRRSEGRGPVPLHRLVPELVELARVGETVARVAIDTHWVAIRRGSAALDRDEFRLAAARTGDWEWLLP